MAEIAAIESMARPRRLIGSRGLALLLFLPATLILFSWLVVLPIVDALSFSFFDWNGYGPKTEFVGTENYADVLTHRHFPTALRNTGLVIAASLLLQLPLALWCALGLVETSWFSTVVRALFFLPYMLAEIAAGLIWRFVYDGENGLMPVIGDAVGADLPFLLGDRFWVMPALLVVVVWKYFGFHMMIYIAALQAIPKEVIEAARLDGVSKWRIVWYIKLPMIRSAIMITVFFAVTGALQLFDLIFSLTGGGPSHSSHTIVSFLYQFGITRMKLGFGGAVSVILFLACVAVTLVYQQLLKAQEER